MRSAFALRIDSGSIIIIRISANPAGLAEILFHGKGRRDDLHLLSESVVLSLRPLCENSVWSTPQSATNAKY